MLTTLVFGGTALVSLYVLVRIRWLREKQADLFSPTRPVGVWPGDAVLWGGWLRADATSALFMLTASLWSLLRDASDGRAQFAADVLLVLILVSMVLSLTVMLFNRPKWLVARKHRDEPGAVREWLDRSSDHPADR